MIPGSMRAAGMIPARWLVLLGLLLAQPSGLVLGQQDEPKTSASSKQKASASAFQETAKEPEKAPSEDEGTAAERWEDPRANAALENTFPELPSVVISPADIQRVKEMAAGGQSADRALIEKYIKRYAADLTSKRNISALMDPRATSSQAKALEQAALALIEPLNPPPSSATNAFRREYIRQLHATLAPLLKGHLHTRTFAMIVLSRTADPAVAKTLIDQLADPDQLLSVKLLAASGLSGISQASRAVLEPATATPAARNLSEFLKRERESFWPAHHRALEAMGWMRIATSDPTSGKAELAQTAVEYLLDPKVRPEVRAQAAWTLGMLQVPTTVRDYNFSLIAYGMGRLALEVAQTASKVPLPIGGKTDEEKKANNLVREQNFPQINRATDLLLRLLLALNGDPQIRDSGLLRSTHPSLSPARDYVSNMERKIHTLATATLRLSESAGVQIEENRKELIKAADDLRAFVGQKPPTSPVLYRGGSELSFLPAISTAAEATTKPAPPAR